MVTMVTLSLSRLVSLSFFIRVCLVLYGEIHDSHSLMQYTDVDYKVFSDAARHVRAGASPYQRLTYRYVLSPNLHNRYVTVAILDMLIVLRVPTLIMRILL